MSIIPRMGVCFTCGHDSGTPLNPAINIRLPKEAETANKERFIIIQHEGKWHLSSVEYFEEEPEITTIAAFSCGQEWDYIKAVVALLNKHAHELDEAP